MKLIPDNLHTFVIDDISTYPIEGYSFKSLLYKKFTISKLPENNYSYNKSYLWNKDTNTIKLGEIDFTNIGDYTATINNKKYIIHIFDTVHSYAYCGFFKPTIYEALLPINRDLLDSNDDLYITTIYAGMSKSERNHYGITLLLTPEEKNDCNWFE